MEQSPEKNHLHHSAIKHFIRLLIHPGRLILSPFYKYFGGRYSKREKFEIKFLLVDLSLLLVAIGLIVSAVSWFIQHNKIENRIFFEAQIAPTEIVSGAPSTLVIRYTNGTGYELKNAYLELSYPAHFSLLELASGETPQTSNVVALGDLAAGTVGSIKIRGIMYGDVGGQQTFETKMSFNYGERNKIGIKTSRHTFSPSRSVLELSLELPEKIIASQPFIGYVVYKNNGEMAIPSFKIVTGQSEEFNLISSQPNLTNGSWKIDGLKTKETGKIAFTGQTKENIESLLLNFNPYFSFENTEYKQDPLTQTIAITKPQVKINHNIDSQFTKLGGDLILKIKYENIGTTPVYDLQITATSNSPLISSIGKKEIGGLAAGAVGETEIILKLKNTITQSEVSAYQNLEIETKGIATYKMERNEAAQKITISDTAVNAPLTTPIYLRSIGRYTSDRGDQLGRGPLPPVVDDETKYWIFWSITGTTNEINNLTLSGELPDNVIFTGRQTVSEGAAVIYNSNSQTVTWKIDKLPTTFSSTAKTIGVAFEVGLTPTIEQVGQTPTLISNITASGTDAWTGAWVTASGSSVTTNLPGDLMAGGLEEVIE